jgi:glucose-1-phosphate thymidylyltransferase
MLAGIRDILIISTPADLGGFQSLLSDGSSFGINIQYATQPSPDGLAQALIIGEEFLGNDSCCLILGDNLFYGGGLISKLDNAIQNTKEGKATIFGYYVNDPERFGIMEFDQDGKIISIEEKPEHPKSNYCITGLYFYDNRAVEFAKRVKPSKRGELEITSLNQFYLDDNTLHAQILGRGFAWMDTGTVDSIVDATTYVQMIEKRQGLKISVPEEIAYRNHWIDKSALLKAAVAYGKSPYGEHLKKVAEGIIRY